jgi:signal peptide peptidase SppA
MQRPHLMARAFNMPLLIQRAKLDVIVGVLDPTLASAIPPKLDVIERASAGITLHDGIAVLPIHGTLVQRTLGLDALSGLTSYTALTQSLDALLADAAVQGIVLDIDSSGGEVAGVFDLADRIHAARAHKPIWAVANEAAFSAAYVLASAAERVYLTRTAGVGSIGVIALHVDQSQKDAREGLYYTPITAGRHKDDGNPHAPLSDQARAVLQTEVDRIYALLINTVAAQRGISIDVVRQTEAALFFGSDAIDAGLADRVGTLADAIYHLRTARAASPLPHSENPSMSTQSPAIEVAESERVRACALADALAIAQLCELAGQPVLTATYLAEGITPETARERLLALRAQTPEITSHLDPVTPTPTTSLDDNPLIQAVKARVALTPKER